MAKSVFLKDDIHAQLRLTAIHNSETLQKTVDRILRNYYEGRKND